MAVSHQIYPDLAIELKDGIKPSALIKLVSAFSSYAKAKAEEVQPPGTKVSCVLGFGKTDKSFALYFALGAKAVPGYASQRLHWDLREAHEKISRMISSEMPQSIRKDLQFMASGANAADVSRQSVRRLMDLLELASKTGKCDVLFEQEPVIVDWDEARQHLAMVADYEATGTIDGIIQTISEDKLGIKVKVKDRLYPKPIKASLAQRLVDRSQIHIGKRLELAGRICYRRGRIPHSMEARSVTIMPEDHELPSIKELRGIMAKPAD